MGLTQCKPVQGNLSQPYYFPYCYQGAETLVHQGGE